MLSNNTSLPTLPAIAARSTWAIIIATVITGANAMGIDLLGFLGAIGAGSTTDEVIATGERVVSAWQMVAPLILGIWAWIERRAPNFRLTLWPGKDQFTLHFAAALLLSGMILGGPGKAQADPAPVTCGAGLADVTATLFERYGEKFAFMVTTQEGQRLLFWANPETGSWTALRIDPGDIACPIGAGTGFFAAPIDIPGDPA